VFCDPLNCGDYCAAGQQQLLRVGDHCQLITTTTLISEAVIVFTGVNSTISTFDDSF